MLKEVLDKTDIDEKIIKTAKNVQKEYKKTLIVALNTGLAFIIALYTKEFLQSLVGLILTKLNMSETAGIISQGVIALLVIVLCVVVIVMISTGDKDEN